MQFIPDAKHLAKSMNTKTGMIPENPGLQVWVKKYSVELFCILTVVLTTLFILLPLPALAGPVVVVFLPWIVASILIRYLDGKGQIRAQLFRPEQWRFNLKWTLISLGLAAALRLGASLLGLVFVSGYQFKPGPFSPLLVLTILFATGEQIGWRGFALQRLLKRGVSPLAGAIGLGVPWALLHLPLTLPGKLSEGVPPIAQFLVILSLSVLVTWLFMATGGGIWPAVLLHGGQNGLSILNNGLPVATASWLMVVVYGAAAVAIVILTKGRLGQK